MKKASPEVFDYIDFKTKFHVVCKLPWTLSWIL